MDEEPSAPPETTPPEAWRAILGTLSFVLGLLSCFTCAYGVLSGILAILLGVFARKSLSRRQRLALGLRMAEAGIFLGYIGAAIGLIVFLILPALFPPVRRGNPYTCQNNLKHIGIILKMYAGENGGALPNTLSTMYPEYATDPTAFVCPQSGKKPGDPAHMDEWSDYAYVPGLHKTGTPADADALVCYEREYRHTPQGRNELYLDGHVESLRLGQPHR